MINFLLNFIKNSVFWLYLYKLSKYIQNKVLKRGSELQRICSVENLIYLKQGRFSSTGYFYFLLFGQRIVLNDEEIEEIFSKKNGIPLPFRLVYQVDRSLLYSTQLKIQRRQLESKDCSEKFLFSTVLAIAKRKSFASEPGTSSSSSVMNTFNCKILYQSIIQIYATQKLLHETSLRASTKYDHTNLLHEKKLADLWNILQPSTPLTNRISKEWGHLGFQGVDPATDFRGMGVLGLDQLLYFAKHHPKEARYTLNCSRDPRIWYQWALVGINITAFVLQLLRSRRLQIFLFQAMEDCYFAGASGSGCWSFEWKLFYAYLNGEPTDDLTSSDYTDNNNSSNIVSVLKEAFNELYCFVFHSFNSKWIEVMTPKVESQYNSEMGSSNVDKPFVPILEFPLMFSEFKNDIQNRIIQLDVNEKGAISYEKLRIWSSGGESKEFLLK